MFAVSLNVHVFQGGEDHGSEGEETSQLKDDDTTFDDKGNKLNLSR